MTATGSLEMAARSGERAAGAGEDASRAAHPVARGEVERNGVRVAWACYGHGEPAVLMLPTWSIVDSRFWKAQVPFLARHRRVITFDGRGSGRSDRPAGAAAYAIDEFAADALAVLDATGTARAHAVALSCGALWATVLAAENPERIVSVVYIGPAVGLAPGHPERDVSFEDRLDTDAGWAKYNRHYWARDYRGFLDFFFPRCFGEPHSTKPIEDGIDWALDTDPEVLTDATRGIALRRAESFAATCARVSCPTLVLHGDRDLVRPLAQGEALARATGGTLVTLAGSGHMPQARDPVLVNELLADAFELREPPRRWIRARERPPRALFVSSPIGLGHARRDLAIARALRRRRPGLEIEWLAQAPVTTVLEHAGERIHPASTELALESDHIDAEARPHELRVFDALRRMDEILAANFMLFRDVVREDHYDLWIADEGWELDHFLHENPELKTSPFVWMTDFVGYLPLPAGGEREAELTADYNAEMLEHVARFPAVRDRSLFIGEPDDIVPGTFGPGLPVIRDWTAEHFRFVGYEPGFDRDSVADRRALRAELGWGEEPVVVVSVGGSGVGLPLLRLAIESLPHARGRVPELQMVVVAGPRIDPGLLGAADGVEVLPFVDGLHRYLAACDVAVVQGGLATTMELTVCRRPFLYFPLARHFEQRTHVHHRLRRHRAGRAMEFADTTPEQLGIAISEELVRSVDYAPVRPGSADRAAAAIAELL